MLKKMSSYPNCMIELHSCVQITFSVASILKNTTRCLLPSHLCICLSFRCMYLFEFDNYLFKFRANRYILSDRNKDATVTVIFNETWPVCQRLSQTRFLIYSTRKRESRTK